MSSDQVNYDMRPVKFYLYRDTIMRNAMAFRKRHLRQSPISSYLFSAESIFMSARLQILLA